MSDVHKARVREFVARVLSRGDIEATGEYFTTDMIEEMPFPGQGPGLEGLKETLTRIRSAFPDSQWTVDEQIAEGDKVVTRFTARGTHRGPLAGVAPSGRFVTVPCMSIDRIVAGQIVESFELFDQLGMFQAIGTLPAISASA